MAENELERHDIVIVGGGTAGITVAAQLTKGWGNATDVAIIEPSEDHYYQPAWTLVAGGTFRKEATRRSEASVIPRKAKWIRDAVSELDLENRRLRTREGRMVEYQNLVVCAGLRMKWSEIRGLEENLGRHGVCCNYSYDTVAYTWECLQSFRGGTAIFTQPSGPIRCGGAPQKICYLSEDYFRRQGLRDKTRVLFASAGTVIFGVKKYRPTMEAIVERRGIETLFRHELSEIRGEAHEAVFKDLDSGEEQVIAYDMIHVTPPMGAPEFLESSALAGDDGWVEVDHHTLQHRRFPEVFSLGDAAGLPTAKTGAAIRKQAPVLVQNLRAQQAGKPLEARYTGYTSCPLVTGYGKVVLAEFDYEGNAAETFPFNQAKERWSMWVLKKYLLPILYWSGMLKGRA